MRVKMGNEGKIIHILFVWSWNQHPFHHIINIE